MRNKWRYRHRCLDFVDRILFSSSSVRFAWCIIESSLPSFPTHRHKCVLSPSLLLLSCLLVKVCHINRVPGYPTERPPPIALALNIVIGGSVGNVTADDFLTVQDSTLTNQVRRLGNLAWMLLTKGSLVSILLWARYYSHSSTPTSSLRRLFRVHAVLQACNDDDACLCSSATVTAITACQQCYFTNIIEENRQMPDPRAGSTPALAGQSTYYFLVRFRCLISA